MLLEKKIFLISSLFYILYVVVPIVPDTLKLPGEFVNLFTFVLLFALYPKAFKNNVIMWFLIYAVILVFYFLFGKPLTIGIGTVSDSKKIIIEFAFILPNLAIFSILYYLRDYKLFNIISTSTLVFILLSFLYLTPQIFLNSLIFRESHNLSALGDSKIFGIPNYLLQHSYVLLISPIMYLIRLQTQFKKILGILFLLFLVFIIVNTYVTTTILITFIIIIASIIIHPNNMLSGILMTILLLFLIYIFHYTGLILRIFDSLVYFFEGTAVLPKIEGFRYIYLYGDIENSGGHITGRMNLHDMSWNAFAENVIIGGHSSVGGHSSLIDRLGGMGLLVFIPFVMIFVSFVRYYRRVITNSQARFYFYLGLGATFLILYQKGLFGQEGWLFSIVLIPSLIATFQKIHLNDFAYRIELWASLISRRGSDQVFKRYEYFMDKKS